MFSMTKIIYIAVIVLILLPIEKLGIPQINAPIALLAGLIFAFSFKNPCPKLSRIKTSSEKIISLVLSSGFRHQLFISVWIVEVSIWLFV